MNNIFEQRITDIINNYTEWDLIRSIPLWIIASIEYKPDFLHWLDFERNNKN